MKLTIGKRVKELRVKNKMTQEQLAEAVDACVGYISKIENNRVNNISLSLACELASVLNVSLGYLVGESTENEMMDIMYTVGKKLPAELRETALGGCALSPSACAKCKIKH